MIKAFISHSSKQKEFAQQLVELLGRDRCIIDCYDFEAAYKTVDEVYKHIDNCSIFVLLISRESLDSEWVKEEIAAASKKMSPNQLDRFWPFIIDPQLTLEDIPKWLYKDQCFNIKLFASPFVLARDIQQKFRVLIWNENPSLKALQTAFVGRNAELGHFEEKIYSSRGHRLKALLISGRPGVGKDAFTRQCLLKLGKNLETEPYHVSLDVKSNIEDFILQLNLITLTYSSEELITHLAKRSPEGKAEMAVQMLNSLYETRSVILIDDNMSCVLPNRFVSDWLIDILEDKSLNNQLGLFIKAQITPNAYVESDYPEIAHINLQPLNRGDRKKLFYQLCRLYELTNMSEKDIDFFVDKLLQSPSQIFNAVSAIRNTNILQAKADVQRLVAHGDNTIKPLIDHFRANELHWHLMIILSKFEFVSFDVLEKIYTTEENELQAAISEMMVYGIVTTFGPSDMYLRLDHYICDYVKRNHLHLPADLESNVSGVVQDLLTTTDITEDTSLYLYKLKHQIIRGHSTPENYIFPSVVIKAVMEAYNLLDYNLVINICDKVLKDFHNYYKEVENELYYWLCLSLCRTAKENPSHADRFWSTVKHIDGAEHSFLEGFYFRNTEDYSRAEKNYKKALESAPTMSRAKRELVTALLAQGKYEDAEKLAQENYEKESDNTYHIYAFFRCLVKKRPIRETDRKTMQELLRAVRDSYFSKKEEFLLSMNLEFNIYVNHKSPTEVLKDLSEAQKLFPNSTNIQRIVKEYKRRQAI